MYYALCILNSPFSIPSSLSVPPGVTFCPFFYFCSSVFKTMGSEDIASSLPGDYSGMGWVDQFLAAFLRRASVR